MGSAPDMVVDDLPSNMDYLDQSFGAAGGLREFDDNDLDDFGKNDAQNTVLVDDPNIVSKFRGETVKMVPGASLGFVENYFNTLPGISEEASQ